MNDEFDEKSEPELTADEKALLEEMPTLTDVGQTRRAFLGQTIAGGLGVFALELLAHEEALAALVTRLAPELSRRRDGGECGGVADRSR